MSQIQVQGFSPTPKQFEFIQEILKPEVKFIILTTGRQFGKTMMAQNLILKWALETNDSVSMWVSPIYSQCRKVFEDLEKILYDSNLTTSLNKSNLEIEFINGSKIIFRSAERPDNMRGYTLDYLVVDEAAFVRDDTYNMVLKHTTIVKGKKVLFISTPKGKNYLYELSLRAQDENNEKYIHLKGTSFDSPYISEDELMDARRTLPEDIYKQEILGEFIDNGGEVFTDIDKYCVLSEWVGPRPGVKYSAGIDFGRVNDYTVLSILDDNKNLVYQYRDNNKPWQDIIENIIRILNQYKAHALIEVNSIGDVLYEQIQRQYNNIEPFITSSSSKNEIIEDLIFNLNDGKMKLPNEQLCPALFNELKSFTYTYSPRSRNISYGAATGAHDDTIMSLAIALKGVKTGVKKGVYHIY